MLSERARKRERNEKDSENIGGNNNGEVKRETPNRKVKSDEKSN